MKRIVFLILLLVCTDRIKAEGDYPEFIANKESISYYCSYVDGMYSIYHFEGELLSGLEGSSGIKIIGLKTVYYLAFVGEGTLDAEGWTLFACTIRNDAFPGKILSGKTKIKDGVVRVQI